MRHQLSSPRLTDPTYSFKAFVAMPCFKFGGVNHVGYLQFMLLAVLFLVYVALLSDFVVLGFVTCVIWRQFLFLFLWMYLDLVLLGLFSST